MRQDINIQDGVLFGWLREGASVSMTMMTGKVVEGRLVRFDRYCLILEAEPSGIKMLIYKHAIADVTGKQPRKIAERPIPVRNAGAVWR